MSERDQLIQDLTNLKVHLSRENKLMLKTLQQVYRKHHMNDPSIEWEELDEMVFDTLCDVMGDEVFQEWVKKVKEDQNG